MQTRLTSKTVLGPEHPNTLLSMWNLSHTLKRLGRNAEALSLLQACVQFQEQRLGPAHPDTVAATADLKEWQKTFKYSTSRPPFHLRYVSKTISTIRGAIQSKKK